ncbi:hypothetical protein NQ317_008118 [Molorchus minor]|uniref:NADH dehydrogenase [ubiquinone] 1 beta subcomplex subunit 8, mitochondrial n=1 Tax=Molorchus minor TaxID=1323400 RepID=A0ABQ9JZM5_9CUCU|nr:hypothetical protein NQ317_008118 [Molorchus minor]
MNLIKPVILHRPWLKANFIYATTVRNHLWTKDYKPGPFPKTEEQRAAAAEKYGLPLSEYASYPDDGGQALGDYPCLPMISAEVKDPYYPWDNPELKRNFNEPMHYQFDLLREDRYNVNARFRKPMWYMLAQCLGAMLSSFGLFWVCDFVKMFHPVTPRQYPKKGAVGLKVRGYGPNQF